MNLLQEIEKAGPGLIALGQDIVADFEDKAIDAKTLNDAETAAATIFPSETAVISLSLGALKVFLSAVHAVK